MANIIWPQVQSRESIENFMKQLTSENPQTTKLVLVGQSDSGTPVHAVEITRSKRYGGIVIIDAGHGHNDVLSVSVALYIMHQLVTRKEGSMLYGLKYVIVPVVNVDAYSETEPKGATQSARDRIAEVSTSRATRNPEETDFPVTQPPPPETKPPTTKPPETKPPETKPPETKPPETEPPKTEPPETKPPESTTESGAGAGTGTHSGGPTEPTKPGDGGGSGGEGGGGGGGPQGETISPGECAGTFPTTPETKALSQYYLNFKNVLLYINFHSTGSVPIIASPYGYKNATVDMPMLDVMIDNMKTVLESFPTTEEVWTGPIYEFCPGPGHSVDWAYDKLQAPYCIYVTVDKKGKIPDILEKYFEVTKAAITQLQMTEYSIAEAILEECFSGQNINYKNLLIMYQLTLIVVINIIMQ